MANIETTTIPGTDLKPSRVGLGTWAIGGWMWGGSDDAQSIRTIQAAVDSGITLIDTAPVYGFGHSEEIVGKALAEGGRRDKVVIATKVALDALLRGLVPTPIQGVGALIVLSSLLVGQQFGKRQPAPTLTR